MSRGGDPRAADAAAPGQVEQGPPGRAVHLRPDRLRPVARRRDRPGPGRAGPVGRRAGVRPSSPNSARCRRSTPTSSANDIQLGLRAYRGRARGQLVWRRPRRSTLYEMLRHPIYAGAYVYGRLPVDPTRRVAGRPKSGRRNAAPGGVGVPAPGPRAGVHHLGAVRGEPAGGCAANDRGRGATRATGPCADAAQRHRPVRPVRPADGGPQRPADGQPAVRLRRAKSRSTAGRAARA